MEKQALVTNIQKFSVRDGPGIRSIVFFKGCPLKCQWCANPENISFEKEIMFYDSKCIACNMCAAACANGAITADEKGLQYNRSKCSLCGMCVKACSTKARVIKGNLMEVKEVIEDIDSDIIFYKTSGGGVTFSGGEPLLHAEFIKEIARDYREKGLSSVVETCGCVPWEKIELVKEWIDLFLYDVKFIDEEKHKLYCGGSNELILNNLRRLSEESAVIARIPIIPGINDTERDIRMAGEFLDTLKNDLKGIHILPYHNFGISKYDSLGKEYKLSQVKVPDQEHMNTIKSNLERVGLDVQIGG